MNGTTGPGRRTASALVVRGGRVALPGGELREADVAVDGGRVTAVGEPGTLRGEEVVDARGRLVLPGAVDLHVHLREPGQTHKEDFATGTRAAACGGVTVVCDMPSTQPPVTSAATLRAKAELVAPSAWVDFALWAGGTDVAEFEPMARAGAAGLKVYMVSAPGFERLHSPDDATLGRVLGAAARLGWTVAVHAGDHEAMERERAALRRAGRRDPRAVIEVQRGPGAIAGLRRVLAAAAGLGVRLHVAHLSVSGTRALDEVLAWRARGATVTAETCVPALGLDDLDRLGVYALPTAFDGATASRYWAALAAGEVDAIATDHAPHTRADKEPGRLDAFAAPPGYPALQLSVPLAFDAVLAGRLPLARMVDALATRPAAILGLPRKGRIAPGYDADLMLLDPDATWTVDERALHSKVGWSPFDGRRLRGRVERTYLRGRLVAADGDVVGEPSGRLVSGSAGGMGAARPPLDRSASWHPVRGGDPSRGQPNPGDAA